MTTYHILEFYVGVNGQTIEIVKSLQSVEGAEEGMVLGWDGPELPVGYDISPILVFFRSVRIFLRFHGRSSLLIRPVPINQVMLSQPQSHSILRL